MVVLSNNDGCIISRSNEAMQLGIKMGAPAFQMGELLQRNHVAVFSSNYALYGDLSHRVMCTLGQFTPELEVYSIDEAFMNLAGLPVDLQEYARIIRRTVLKNVGIPVSVGVGPTKVLAKTANHYAKRVPENQGLFVLDSADKIQEALKLFAIDEVWGIGRQYANLLRSLNIKTAWEFTRMQDSWVRKKMTVVGLRVKKELEGISCLEMELIPAAKKAICTSRSFGEPQTELEPLREAVATNSTMELIRYSLAALGAIYQPGYRYKKAGIIVYDIVPETRVQGALFDHVDRDKHAGIMKTLDRINAKYGRDTVKIAAQGSGQRWKLRQEKLSPCYTTRWEDIITVRV